MASATPDLRLASQSLPRDWYKIILLGYRGTCVQLASGRYLSAAWPGVELATSRVAGQRLNHYTTRPQTGAIG